jgi:hypothetical protein
VGFSSFEENTLFTGLVQSGFMPDMALFINGVNEFARWDGQARVGCDPRQPLSQTLQNSLPCDPEEVCWPIQRLGAEVVNWFPEVETPASLTVAPTPPPLDDLATNNAILDRWLVNKRAIEAVAARYGVQTVFVMQPHTLYAYDLQYHLFVKSPEDAGRWARGYWGYPLWEARYNDPESEWTENVINLSRLGEDNQGPLYLDIVHYTHWFMDEIGAALAEALIENGWIEGAP